MSSAPADKLPPSPEAEHALRLIRSLSERDRFWIYEQIESAESVGADQLAPDLRDELERRLRSLHDGTAELHDLDDVERQALRLLGR